jgi:hypothetical protein
MAIVAIGIETLMICSLISTTEKEGRPLDTAGPVYVTGMEFPLDVRLTKCAAGSTVLQSRANIYDVPHFPPSIPHGFCKPFLKVGSGLRVRS